MPARIPEFGNAGSGQLIEAQGFGFRVWGLGFRVSGVGFRV